MNRIASHKRDDRGRLWRRRVIVLTSLLFFIDQALSVHATDLVSETLQPATTLGKWNNEGLELLLDREFKKGFSAIPACNDPDTNPRCGSTDRYSLKDPGGNELITAEPVWQLAQWGSRASLSRGAFFGKDGYGWSDKGKRIVVFTGGRVEFVVNGNIELSNSYPDFLHAWPSLIITQMLGAPGPYSRDIGSLDIMSRLDLAIDFRVIHEKQNRRPGYDASKHALIFPMNFTIQNLNPRSNGYGEYAWLQINLYDDRQAKTRIASSRTAIDIGTKRMIFFAPTVDFIKPTNEGNWTSVGGDILPYAKEAAAAAYRDGLFHSGNLSDYSIGTISVGYELTGLNEAAFQIRNLSLRMYRAAHK